jgi:hypothetical protein
MMPWRYRRSDLFRDEVLAHLLEFKKQRAEEKRLSGPGSTQKRASATQPQCEKTCDAGLFSLE